MGRRSWRSSHPRLTLIEKETNHGLCDLAGRGTTSSFKDTRGCINTSKATDTPSPKLNCEESGEAAEADVGGGTTLLRRDEIAPPEHRKSSSAPMRRAAVKSQRSLRTSPVRTRGQSLRPPAQRLGLGDFPPPAWDPSTAARPAAAGSPATSSVQWKASQSFGKFRESNLG